MMRKSAKKETPESAKSTPMKAAKSAAARPGPRKGNNLLGPIYLKELAAEAPATRKCLERIPLDKVSSWKPHEKSMGMGYLTVLIADMPRWISHTVTVGDIDFETWENAKIQTTEELLRHFDRNMADVRKALERASDEDLEKPFSLRRGKQVFFTSSKAENISSTIRHWAHHRGQLTVYMRLNQIAVPAIYGPSADDKTF